MSQQVQTQAQTTKPAVASKAPLSVNSLLESQRKQIEMALPKHMKPDRMLRIALTEMRLNPKLSECDPMSFLGAIIQCSQLGLEPSSAFGQVYLIPFRNNKRGGTMEVQVIPGYKGLIELARRSGVISSISARCVYEKDHFEYVFGLDETMVHEPYAGLEDRGQLTHAYTVAKFKDGSYHFEVMNRNEIEKIRAGTRYPNPVWETHYDEMAKKTVIRRICKYLPLTPEMAEAATLEAMPEKEQSQDNHALISIDYEPQKQISAEAVNISEHMKAEMKKAESEPDQNLCKQVRAQIDTLRQMNQKDDSIMKYLAVQDLNIESWPKKKLEAAFEALMDFTAA